MQNMSCKIYMDHAATTEMLPQVRKAMEPYLMEEYGNASTSYEMGRRTREALEGAREQIAMLIKAKPEEIFFTSGGSESDNWVIKNVAEEKKSLSLENEARIKAFDDEVDKKTEEKLEGIRKGLEVDMEQELLLQKQQTEATLKKMEAGYEQRVEAMVQELYDKILRM